MARYKFIKKPDKENEFDFSTVTTSFETTSLDDILEELGDFLKGCGFSIDGDLQVVKECITDLDKDGN